MLASIEPPRIVDPKSPAVSWAREQSNLQSNGLLPEQSVRGTIVATESSTLFVKNTIWGFAPGKIIEAKESSNAHWYDPSTLDCILD